MLSQLDGRIHDAKFKFNAGGVGRNITEALSKLGYQPTFISVVGNDTSGQYLHSLLPESCSQSVKKLTDFTTAQCTIIFDCNGDCKMLLGDMDIHQQITPTMINHHQGLIRNCPLLVLDGNLSLSTLEAALKLAEKHDVPVLFEPTDVPIAEKPFLTQYWRAIKYITPNLLELKEIAKALNIPSSHKSSTEIDEAVYLANLVSNHIPNVIATLGSNGLLIARKAEASEPLLKRLDNDQSKGSTRIRHYPTDKIDDLINVSGAGDCLASGLIAGMLKGYSEETCVKVAYAAARASLCSQSAVPAVLFDQTHQSWQTKAAFETVN